MHGVWTALITPFNENGELDKTSFTKIIEDQCQANVAGLVVCGTTGESPCLTMEEKKSLIQIALGQTKNSKVKIIAGTGTNNTKTSVDFSKWASDQGVSGVLVVTPYYNKPSQAGLEAHFRSVADNVSCPVILYNVPSRTGVSLSAETVVKLSSHKQIAGLKEASGNISLSSEILSQIPSDRAFSIFSGDDVTFLPLLSVGAKGVISVASNLFPRAMVNLQIKHESGCFEEARKIHQHYYPLFRDLFIETNPVPIKYAMSKLGWCGPTVRLPLVPVSEKSACKIDQSLELCGLRRGKPA